MTGELCVLCGVYQLNGKFVSSIGSKGSGELEFNFPRGLSTNEYNNDIYICDTLNHRIQIISENLQFKSQFGKDTLHFPRDIKHYKDNIFILDESNPCLHIFNRDLVLQQSVVTRGRGQQVSVPWLFFIDNFGNILTAYLTLFTLVFTQFFCNFIELFVLLNDHSKISRIESVLGFNF